jgi:catalase
MVLDRNPDNFFAETEQVAFHTANVVRGIDFTNDPLLQARNFSYLDTQLIRLGGPNFAQLPVNRPVAPVHHHQRDGYGQHRIDRGQANYHPNSLGGGCPALASFDEGGFRNYTERVDGQKVRRRSESFQDHFSQATLFWNSMSDWEQQHIVDAFSFELGKVDHDHIRERVIAHLARVDGELAAQVAGNVGVEAPTAGENHGKSSPALSQADQPQSAATRKVAVLIADGVETGSLRSVLDALEEQGTKPELLAPRVGKIRTAGGDTIDSDRAIVTMASVLYDAVLVADGEESVSALAGNGEAVHYVAEAYRHGKPVGAIGAGTELLRKAPLPDGALPAGGADPGAGGADPGAGGSDPGAGDADPGAGGGGSASAGVITTAGTGEPAEFVAAFVEALAGPRQFDRPISAVPA